MTGAGPVYECAYAVDTESLQALESWLVDRLANVAIQRGVLDAQLFSLPAGDDRAVRGYRVVFDNEDALEQFIVGTADDIDDAALIEFGAGVEISARVLREIDTSEVPATDSPDCLNCGARLSGQYCGQCGQRARSRLISLWELVRDAFGDLFELDSRLWRTLVPLFRRPGLLTADYLKGRRARYMPPFRMYLVMSLLFFLVAFFDPSESLGVLFDPVPAEQAESGSEEPVPESAAAEENPIQQEVVDEPAMEGAVVEDDDGVTVSFDGEELEDCDVDNFELDDAPIWLQRRLTPERMAHICREVIRDEGNALAGKVVDNIPAALIILLPIMAFVLTLIYPLSRRYYVEHLLFFVHFHAFFFLMLTLQIMFGRVIAWLSLPEWIAVLVIVFSSFYIPVYLFIAMRRVYNQGRFITFTKYIVLSVAYVGGFTATMLGAVVIAAFSI